MPEPYKTDPGAIVNRHMARLLTNLEQAGCPAVYLAAVKSELVWLRTDLNELEPRLTPPDRSVTVGLSPR